ncbi:hypothetical protein [Humisphaera borealis]|uniref:Fructose-bisphosphate aldolase n=1 Tax=Humisphaera borealis TaxID=2807512 RepID=A0A7M2WX87_9BACT|nr:hypothetical protein [Humisphaera borealis]QOV90013.1 hypothetical protein IPV69_01165 [Humisphaera borealis]
MKSLDEKLANIHRDPSGSKDFILADAKDADMATGLAATGVDHVTGKRRSLANYRDQIRQVIRQGLVDIVLTSASTNDQLCIRERLFDGTAITPAARANDTTDIHLPAGGTYGAEPSRPFRSATLEQIQSGKVNPTPAERRLGADLGLYSITPNNKLEFDYPTVLAYKDFRIEAERVGFRHFLEVFDPNACGDHCPADLGRFINDLIVRTLAGVPQAGRPVFLKIVYHGPRAMEELATYDPHLVPGILGGASGTTYDAFKQLAEAKKYGARAALYGRKINNSEHQLTFITFLRMLADGKITPEEAVKAYHGELQKLGIKPIRTLANDMQLTTQEMSYAGGGATKPSAVTVPAMPKVVATVVGTRASSPAVAGGDAASAKPIATAAAATAGGDTPAPRKIDTAIVGEIPRKADGSPDFAKMTPAQKVAVSRQRIASEIARDRSR